MWTTNCVLFFLIAQIYNGMYKSKYLIRTFLQGSDKGVLNFNTSNGKSPQVNESRHHFVLHTYQFSLSTYHYRYEYSWITVHTVRTDTSMGSCITHPGTWSTLKTRCVPEQIHFKITAYVSEALQSSPDVPHDIPSNDAL